MRPDINFIKSLLYIGISLLIGGCILLPPQSRDLPKDIYEIKVQVGRLQTMQGDTLKLLEAGIRENKQSDQIRFSTISKNQANLESKIRNLQTEIQRLNREIKALRLQVNGGNEFSSAGITNSGSGGISASGVMISKDGDKIDGDALLKSAMLSFSKGKYDKSRRDIELFMENFSMSPRAAEALFILGDTWFSEKKYNKALYEFLRLSKDYPASDQVPDSLVKASICLNNLSRKKEAGKFLERVIREYPSYRDIIRVRSMLKKTGDE
jgi:tol-pal system protein YbgF